MDGINTMKIVGRNVIEISYYETIEFRPRINNFTANISANNIVSLSVMLYVLNVGNNLIWSNL